MRPQSYKKKIKQLEDDLLFRLSNSQGAFWLLLAKARMGHWCASAPGSLLGSSS